MPFWILFVFLGLVLAGGLGVLAARWFIAASEGDDPSSKHR
ncbi:MAG TPA: hypothetical protein VIN34_11555 [Candidatus Limnocylindria bacterium]